MINIYIHSISSQ